jgi:signal transduction histidine kinase
MTDRKVKTLLFLSVLVVTVLPLLAAFYLLDRVLLTSLNLGFNEQIVQALDTSSENLRMLRDLDVASRETYRQQFELIEELRHVYADPQLVKSSVLESLKIYFGLGIAIAVLLAVAVAATLSGSIASSYAATFKEFTTQRERLRYLEEMASWQELAKMLAHEIKNPLTPIEVLVTALVKSFEMKSPQEFRQQLVQTQTMIGEELSHLKRTVSKFSDFARLPAVQSVEVTVSNVLPQQLMAIETAFDDVHVELNIATQPGLRVNLDPTLFRQVLANIIRNGVEANPGRPVRFDVQVSAVTGVLRIEISNDGVPVPIEIAPRIFDPYISSKSSKDNMGLGLAIVKKILIEHGGDISYRCEEGRPAFVIELPQVTR